jgi:hypothetical protein
MLSRSSYIVSQGFISPKVFSKEINEVRCCRPTFFNSHLSCLRMSDRKLYSLSSFGLKNFSISNKMNVADQSYKYPIVWMERVTSTMDTASFFLLLFYHSRFSLIISH